MLMARPSMAAYTCSFNTHEAEARSPDKLGTKGNPASTKRRKENGCKNCVLIPALLGQIDRMGVGRILFSLEVASSILELFPPSPSLAR